MLIKFLSFLICCWVLYGVKCRKNHKKHITIMLTAFLADVVLVSYLELARDAVGTALGGPHPWVIFHITISTIVLFLYISQIITGRKVLKGNREILKYHRIGAYSFIFLRFSSLITSFWVDQFLTK